MHMSSLSLSVEEMSWGDLLSLSLLFIPSAWCVLSLLARSVDLDPELLLAEFGRLARDE